MKTFFDKFEKFKGIQFISVNGYKSISTGEIANHVININLSVMNAKENDFNKLKSTNVAELVEGTGFAESVCKIALNELLASAEKNLSTNIAERTKQSQAQTDSYIYLDGSKAIRLHKETLQVHIFGQAISKKVIVPGEYKTVNSSEKTMCKNAIKKFLNLSSEKFRDFVLGNIETIKISGETLILV